MCGSHGNLRENQHCDQNDAVPDLGLHQHDPDIAIRVNGMKSKQAPDWIAYVGGIVNPFLGPLVDLLFMAAENQPTCMAICNSFPQVTQVYRTTSTLL